MAQMGQLYRFYLTYATQTVETVPTNWDGMELQMNRTGDVVDRSISLEFEFYGTASTLLRLADTTEGHNALVLVRIDKRTEAWEYVEFKTMKADMTTYMEDGLFTSVAFMEQSLRELVEDKMDTVYEIDVDEDYRLSYTGVDRIRNNVFTAVSGKGISLIYGYSIPEAYHTTSQPSQATTWGTTPFNQLRFEVIEARPIELTINIDIVIKKTRFLGAPPTDGKIGLYRRSSNGTISPIWYLWDTGVVWMSTFDIAFSASYKTGYTGLVNGYRKSTFRIFEHTMSIPSPVVGDQYFIGYQAQGSGSFEIEVVASTGTIFDITETADSLYVSRIMPVLHHERLIEKLLSKMGITNANGTDRTVGNGLTYNLPTEAVNDGFLIAYCGTDSLMQNTGSKMALSLKQAMSLSNMRFASCLRYTDTVVVVDLIANQYDSATEVEISPVGAIKRTKQDSMIRGSVEVSYRTDENDATNVANEVICKNTYTIPSGKGDVYPLATDIICSPYCIEARIDALRSDDSNSDTKDNTVFAFAVKPFASTNDYSGYYFNGIFYTTAEHIIPMLIFLDKVYKDIPTSDTYIAILQATTYTNENGYYYNFNFYQNEAHTIPFIANPSYTYTDIPSGALFAFSFVRGYFGFTYANIYVLSVDTTVLDKRHVGTGVDASYFNIPLSPMRCLKTHAKSIGVSCYGGTPLVVFASTERKADCITKMSYEAVYTDEKVPDATITALLATPYHTPYTYEFTANWKITSIETLANNVLYTAFEQKTGRSIKGYINILTLQLSKVESQQINLLEYEV